MRRSAWCLRSRSKCRMPNLGSACDSDESRAGNFDWCHVRSNNKQRTVAAKAMENFRHGFGAGRCCEDHARAAEFLQRLRGISGFAVDIVMRAKLFRELGIFWAAADGRDGKSKFISELNSKMAQTADALYRHQISRTCAAVAQRIESGDAGAEQWTGFSGVQSIGNAGEGFFFGCEWKLEGYAARGVPQLSDEFSNSSAFSRAASRPDCKSSEEKKATRMSGGIPAPSNAFPASVR